MYGLPLDAFISKVVVQVCTTLTTKNSVAYKHKTDDKTCDVVAPTLAGVFITDTKPFKLCNIYDTLAPVELEANVTVAFTNNVKVVVVLLVNVPALNVKPISPTLLMISGKRTAVSVLFDIVCAIKLLLSIKPVKARL